MNQTGVRSTGSRRQAASRRAAPPGPSVAGSRAASGTSPPPSAAADQGAAQGTWHHGLVTSHDPTALPAGLPVPVDDGAADHLPGMALPSLVLPSTAGGPIDLADAASGVLVLSCYPRTGRPGEDPLPGWDQIPGARGCTPQACAFRDHHAELAGLGARMLGLSTQT